jgi:type VI secretion system protein ImpC
MQLGDVLEIDDLPAHAYREDGEAHLQACAEVFMPERTSIALLGRGLMPLISARDRNSARLARFQSIADPPAALMGPWDSPAADES